MTYKLKPIWIIFALLLLSGTAHAVLTLEQYKEWQGFNGLAIRKIKFIGRHHFAASELLNVMAAEKSSWLRHWLPIGHLSYFYADDFAGDMFRLEHFYSRQGFPHATVSGKVSPDRKHQTVALEIEIQEGPPLILTAWDMVRGDTLTVGLDSIRYSKHMPIKIGKRLTLPDVVTSADTFVYKLKDDGYARASVTYQIAIDSVANTGALRFVATPGRLCYINGTRFDGLLQFGEESARRELTYKTGERYAVHKLEDTRERLVNLEVFTFVTIRADTTVPGDTLPVIVQVEEGRRYHVSTGVGYDTEQHGRATAEFRDLNFFGRARRFTWTGNLAELQRSVEVRFFMPHEPVHVTDITLNPKWNWQKIKNGPSTEDVLLTTILSAKPVRFVTTSIANEFGRRRRHDVGVPKPVPVYTRSVETVSLGWDTRDNPLIPRRGHNVVFQMSESGAFYKTEVRWWRSILRGSALVPYGKYWTLAGRSQFGVMGPLYSQSRTPVDERFYLGGPQDVRGWGLQQLSPRDSVNTPVGGNMEFNITGEIRHNIFGPLVAAVFTDAGNVWSLPVRFKGINLYPSAGLGIMALTPVGPLRLDWAYQLRPNPYGGKKRWSIDVSVGALF